MPNYSTGYGDFTTSHVFADENAEDVSPQIIKRWGPDFPFMGRVKKTSVDNFQFDVRRTNMVAIEYLDKAGPGASIAVNSTLEFGLSASSSYGLSGIAETGAATDIAQYRLAAGDLVMNLESQIVARCVETLGADGIGGLATWTIVSVGDTTVAATTDHYIKIGSAQAENADIGQILLPKMDRYSNYTMITRTPLGLSNTMRASRQHYGSELARQQSDMAKEHMRKLELSSFFSSQQTTLTNIRTTDGILAQISYADYLGSTNATDVGGVLTEANFLTAMDTAFTATNGVGGQKALFCSSKVIRAITNFASDRLVINTSTPAENGMICDWYRLPWGRIQLIHEPWWNLGDDNNGGLELTNGLGVLLDMSDVEFVYLNGRNTSRLTNRQGNGEDKYEEELLTEWGIRVNLPENHYVIYGITG